MENSIISEWGKIHFKGWSGVYEECNASCNTRLRCAMELAAKSIIMVSVPILRTSFENG